MEKHELPHWMLVDDSAVVSMKAPAVVSGDRKRKTVSYNDNMTEKQFLKVRALMCCALGVCMCVCCNLFIFLAPCLRFFTIFLLFSFSSSHTHTHTHTHTRTHTHTLTQAVEDGTLEEKMRVTDKKKSGQIKTEIAS